MSVYRESRHATGTCPRCRETLLAVDGVEGARWCEKCGGVFTDLAASQRILLKLDRGLMEVGFKAALGKVRKDHDARELTCPECGFVMVQNRIESAACTIDACPIHGTWFDTGELVDVLRALDRSRKKGVLLTRTAPSRGPDLEIPKEEPLADGEGVMALIRWLDRGGRKA